MMMTKVVVLLLMVVVVLVMVTSFIKCKASIFFLTKILIYNFFKNNRKSFFFLTHFIIAFKNKKLKPNITQMSALFFYDILFQRLSYTKYSQTLLSINNVTSNRLNSIDILIYNIVKN